MTLRSSKNGTKLSGFARTVSAWVAKCVVGVMSFIAALFASARLAQEYIDVIKAYAVETIVDDAGVIRNSGSGLVVDVGMWSLQASLAGALIALALIVLTPVLYKLICKAASFVFRVTSERMATRQSLKHEVPRVRKFKLGRNKIDSDGGRDDKKEDTN